ncbi:MAG: zinc-ribbon domain-containing protein, partial [Simplicispira sp.]|nr:zinc-ribbon domain-containing protein [Simplicispira sp.]
MSQTTRCPSCATAFKVVADQLRISDGWVRCGHCKEVFDAVACLQEVPAQALLPQVPQENTQAPSPAAGDPEGPARVQASA